MSGTGSAEQAVTARLQALARAGQAIAATANAVRYVNAEVVFADVDPDTPDMGFDVPVPDPACSGKAPNTGGAAGPAISTANSTVGIMMSQPW